MTNEGVIKMLEGLIANYDQMLCDGQDMITRSNEVVTKVKGELRKGKKELVKLEVDDTVVVDGLTGYLIYIDIDTLVDVGKTRYLIEFHDSESGNIVTHSYFNREDITKC